MKQPKPKENLLRQCLEECKERTAAVKGTNPNKLTPAVIEEFYCSRCRNDACSNAQYGDSPWLKRMSTQVDRLFFGDQANPGDPRYQEVMRKDFEDMRQHAMRLIVSSERGDWEVPEVSPILDVNGLPQLGTFQGGESSSPELERHLQDMIQSATSETAGLEVVEIDEDAFDDPLDEEDAPLGGPPHTAKGIPDFAVDLSEPAERRQPVPAHRPMKTGPVVQPASQNVTRRGGIMLDGGPEPAKEAPNDPWAVPAHHNPKARKVKVGGTFQFGSPPDPKEDK